MRGRTVLVTGATSGIGLETALELARRGAHVGIGARDADRGQTAVDSIVRAGGTAELVVVDMASFASIREAAARFTAAHPRLDVLVNNAGIAVGGREVTLDGHERTWETNFLGPFLLTRLLLPSLRSASGARVVQVSSEGHRYGRIDWSNLELERGYKTFAAYANSKLALNLFTGELARREPGILVNAVHPGAIATNIWRSLPAFFRSLLGLILPSAKKGSRPVVRLAADPDVAGVTGRYYNRFRESVPSAAARDDSASRRLWEVAEKAVGENSR